MFINFPFKKVLMARRHEYNQPRKLRALVADPVQGKVVYKAKSGYVGVERRGNIFKVTFKRELSDSRDIGKLVEGSVRTGAIYIYGEDFRCIGEYEMNEDDWTIIPYDHHLRKGDKIQMHPLDYLVATYLQEMHLA
jgi:hypothetical protein